MAFFRLTAVSNQPRLLAENAANGGFCRMIIPLILIFLAIADIGQTQTAIRGLYPPVTELSKLKTVTASSTCGLNNNRMTYCMSSVDNSTLTTCTQLSCLLDCCSTCGKTQPTHTDLLSGSGVLVTQVADARPGSATGVTPRRFTSGSFITYSSLPASNIPLLGMSVCSWIKKQGSSPGALISKGSTSFAFIIKQYDIDFLYTTRDAVSVLRNATIKNINILENEWQHVAFVVYDRKLSIFLNGNIQRTVILDGIINDVTTDARIGQRLDGSHQFVGLLQELKYFARGLTNREVTEAMNETLPPVYGYPYCRCPPSHPKIIPSRPLYCTENGIDSSATPQLRLGSESHVPEFLVDGDIVRPWISELVENATVEIDLVYRELQVFQVQIMFYSPPSKGIKIERSLDGGRTYVPWQYFADDCQRMFGLVNNGPLTQPDSVNCLQITSPVRTDFESLSFLTQEPGPESKPQRPIGEPGCSDFHCSPKLLQFVKATNVKISFYQHMLVTNARHKYFGVRRILVSGSCDCYGHGSSCTTFESNSTHNASYTCTCDSRTFTQGLQCQECLPLYRDKPFKRGMVLDAFPCKKCNCNDHSTSCTYNSSLDTIPSDRTTLGGGVCDNCQHNTMGRFCETCKPLFYRPSGKAVNALDVCSSCQCVGSGVVAQNSDCQRDDSNSSVIAGQCPCKKYTTGRQCNACKDGYYYMTAGNPNGCIACECNTAGILSGNVSCHITNGQCNCKANVYGLKCSTCRPGFYGLSASKADGCSSCNCDPWGSTGSACDVNSGQCPCKSSTEGLRCHQCKNGYHSLASSGCQQCRCNVAGTDPAQINLCNKSTGNCVCRSNVEGGFCDTCKVGHYNLSRTHTGGCLACNCDSKGTQGNSGQCNPLNGTCGCKSLVEGRRCNVCRTGTFNLTAENVDGCTRCNCNPKGTTGGDTTPQSSLPCFSNGQCNCLTNVDGLRCDQCRSGFYWNSSGQGCVTCSCDIQGSSGPSCNATGHCNCRAGSGVGGQRCDRCLPGFYNYNSGSCTACGCSTAGSTAPNCDSTGRCSQCKPNVQGSKCDQCKPGTSNLQPADPFGCSGPPSEQGPPVISNITARSIVAAWFPPDTPNGLILRYELFRNGTLVYNGTRRLFTDTGLTPYTWYSFYIIVYTAGGSTRSVDSSKVYRTQSDSPAGLSPPQLLNVQARSVEARWQPPTYPNGLIIAYRVASTSSRGSTSVHYTGRALSTLVTGLRPFTVYNFTVTACNVIGCVQSDAVPQATRSSAPDSQPKPYLTALDGGQSVFVYWDPPAEPNGVIQFYDLFMSQHPFNTAGATIATKLNPAQRNFTVTGLRPFTEYQFRVVSYTSQVKGDTSSPWSKIRTLESVPAGSEYISPRTQAVSSKSVNVSWRAPGFPNGNITRYNIYRFEPTDLSTPIPSGSALGTARTAVVVNLRPYTSYQIAVKACNSKGCSGFSSRSSVQTLADVPSSQGPPNATSVNSSSVRLSWTQPAIPNGPLPVGYQTERSLAALSFPPPQVERGMRFPGFGFYQLPSAVIPDSAETRLEFDIKTQFTDGLVFYAASNQQEDMFAVELRSGKPWFIFDTETGPAAFTVTGSVRVDDGAWHTVLVTRTRRDGRIRVDSTYVGTGSGGGSANIVGQISSVYVGGLPRSYQNRRSDTGDVVLKRAYFIGCLRNMRYKNVNIDFSQAVQQKSVDPLYAHCPSDLTPGIHFKGGGYVALPSGNFTGGSLFIIQMLVRTTRRSGLLLFAHGGGGATAIALTIDAGNLTLLFKTPSGVGRQSARVPQICDGWWHNITLNGFSSFSILNIDGASFTVGSIPPDAVVNSRVYLGGVPKDSTAANVLKELAKADIEAFGGCLRSIHFARKVVVQRDVLESRNVAFDGCPADFGSGSSAVPTCVDQPRVVGQIQSSTSTVDSGLLVFNEYLYRVRSMRSGISGFAASEWVSVRTKEGAPSGIAAPVAASYDARWVEVTWNKPGVSGGLLTKYQVRATDVSNASAVVSANVTDTRVTRHNLTGVEPYTTYNLSILAFTSGGYGASRVLRLVTRDAAPESLEPPTAIAYPRALFISWKPPRKPNGGNLSYQLQVNGLSVTVKPPNPLSYNATGLSVYTRYRIVLRANNTAGWTSSEASLYTGQLPPTGIHAPVLRVLGSRRVEVSWRVPDVPNGVISKYEVLAATSDVVSRYAVLYNATSDMFSTVVANMTPGTLYYFRIAASTAGGRTVGNVSQARTFESSPEDVLPPLCIPISPSAINVTIQIPLKPNGVILYYELYQDNLLVKNDTNLFHQGTGFLPYTRHTYKTRACTAKGCGESGLVTVFTLDAQPIGNVVLQINVISSRSFAARWTGVQTPNGIIRYNLLVTGTFYVSVDASGNPSSYATRNMTRTVYSGALRNASVLYDKKLLPFTAYSIQVNASNRAGYILSNHVAVSTPPDAPEGVQMPNVRAINSTTLNVTWIQPMRANGLIMSYQLVGRFPSRDLSFVNVSYRSGIYFHEVVGNLQPYTNYSFKVIVNGTGGSSESNWRETTTPQDIPEHIDQPKIVNIESRTVFVEISAPSKPNGVIILYILYLNGTEVNRTLETRFQARGLVPFSFYDAYVSCCTVIGCKSSVRTKLFQTLEDVPAGLSAPTLRANGSRTVIVAWSRPLTTNGIILTYQIQRRLAGGAHPILVGTVNATTSPNIFADRTVKPWRTYEFRVIARTIAGGTPGPYSSISMPEGDPEGIPSPNVTVLTSSSVFVQWTSPSSPNGHVTHYYIVTSGRRDLVNRTINLSYTLTGLGSYIEYAVVVAACTIGGCGNSQPTFARTLPSAPYGQPRPTADAPSATSLRVRWSNPTYPNGPIVQFVLSRRTVEDAVSGSSSASYPTSWIIVYRGSSQVYDDISLGIYSLQQYKVMAITTMGNTSSNASASFRTGAASPLQGVNLIAHAIDHASVRLVWLLPPLQMLRGPAIRFDISYEIVGGPVFISGSLQGNETGTVIRNLRPRTRYAFEVSMFNGAGSRASSKAVVQTLDGSPEGFDAPTLYVVTSSEIRVSWTAPRVPNGIVVNYTIYGNNKAYDSVSGTTLSHTQSNLKAYTDYTIQVQACTLYACTLSSGTIARTLSAPPGLINPPVLEPLSSSSLRVRWALPVEPNGPMVGYEVYRRRVYNCPETPKPLVKCSYVECRINEQLCNGRCYSPSSQICCNGTLHQIDATKFCCGKNYLRKSSPTDVCCGGAFHFSRSGYKCCHGHFLNVPAASVCCRGQTGVVVGLGNSCCGDVPYDVNGSKTCVCGALYDRVPLRKCCGGQVISGAEQCCGNQTVGKKYDFNGTKACCGTDYVDRDTSLCCGNSVGQFQVHVHSSLAQKSRMKCCGANQILQTSSCCNNQSYDNSTQFCADRSTYGVTGCGSGRVCRRDQASTAYCNRCNFNAGGSICGSVAGYFDPSANATNTTVRLCFENYTEVLRNPANPGILVLDDRNLLPHTLYDYYVVGINTEGRSRSAANRTRTLMAKPEGLSAPQATTLSATRIAITWSAPARPNGVIQAYKLYRIKWATKQESLVFSGLSFSHTDAQGLEPFTGYMYIISACTVLCVNTSAASLAYTEQAAPQNVRAPLLRALSSTVIQVNWTTPGSPNGNIVRFNVSRLVNGTYISILRPGNLGLALSQTVTGLSPYTLYTFNVTACTSIGCSAGPAASIRTNQAPPEGLAPPSLTVVDNRTVDIEWKQPTVANGIILRYSLYRNSSRVYQGPLLRFTDRGLTPSMIYGYHFEATTGGGGTNSSRSIVKMPESTPAGIAAPALSSISSSQLHVSWQPPSHPNGVITRYELIYNEVGLDRTTVPVNLLTTYTINGLKPFTQYEVRVKACTVKGCGTGDRSVARTQEAAPSGQQQPTLATRSSSIIEVNWRPPQSPNGIITQYKVLRRELNTVLELVIYFGTAFEYIDTGLNPYTFYQYKVESLNSAGFVQSQWASARTASGIPQGLSAPSVTVISGVSAQVSWLPPTTPNGLITGYEVRARPFSQPSSEFVARCCIQASVLNVTVIGLRPATTYEFRVAAMTSAGSGFSSWTLGRTQEDRPANISRLRTNKDPDGRGDGMSLQVLWSPPLTPNGAITNYVLYLGRDTVYQGLLLQTVIRRLSPYTNYTFTLEVCNSAGCTKGNPEILITAEVVPQGQMAPSVGTFTATSVTLRWQPPLSPNGLILRYDVLRRVGASTRRRRQSLETIVYSTNQTAKLEFAYTDSSLTPSTTYQYKIRAINSKGQIDSGWQSVTTASAPPGGVYPPNATALSGFSVRLQWSLPQAPNGEVRYYIVLRNGTTVGTVTGMSYLDSNLNPVTLYVYAVSACTVAGCTTSSGVHVTTQVAAPGDMRPPVLEALDANRIRATWTPPSVPNGQILKYQLRLSSSQQPVFEGLASSYVVSGLSPYTLYSLSITACTSVGCGSPSTPASTRTMEAAPQNLDPPSLFVLGPTTIEAAWKLPRTPNGVVLYYTLRRGTIAVYNGTDLRFVDRTVAPGRRYAYTVSCTNSVGSVTSAAQLSQTTTASAPENVTKPSLQPLSPSSVQVSWTPPEKPNGAITRYYVLVGGREIDVGIQQVYIVRNLNFYTLYEFRVSACTSGGCTSGPAASARTLEAGPTNQSAPIFHSSNVGSRFIVAEWLPPLHPNGAIRTYELRRRFFGVAAKTVYTGPNLSYNDSSAEIQPNVKYEYQVISINSAGKAASRWAPITTAIDKPEQVKAVSILPQDIKSDSFVFTVEEPGKPNGRIVSYTVEVIGITNITLSLVKRSSATGLTAYTEYSVRMYACNTAGCSAGPTTVVRTAASAPAGFGTAPVVVSKTSRSVRLRWTPPTNLNGPFLWYQVTQRFTCPQASIPPPICVPLSHSYNASNLTTFSVTGLRPYVSYRFKVTVYNSAGLAHTPEALTTTDAESPVVLAPPNVTMVGSTITIEWTRSFDLRSLLEEYSVEENLIQAYTGNKLSVVRPNREIGTYSYVVKAKTLVNGREVVVEAPLVSINVGDVATTVAPVIASDVWYQQVWVLALFGLAGALVIMLLLVLIFRRCSGGIPVYAREREPLPDIPKSKLGSRSASRTSLDSKSDRRFPYIGTPSPSRQEAYQMTQNLYSSRQQLVDSRIGPDFTPTDDKLSFLDPAEPSWETYLKGFSSSGKDRDSGLFDEPSPTLQDDDDSVQFQSVQKERILFPDTHL